MSETRRIVTALAAMALGIVLAGCGASANLTKPCCGLGL